MSLTIFVKGRSTPELLHYDFPYKKVFNRFLTFGSGDSGLAHYGWFVHKVEAAVMHMGKGGVTTGTELETQQGFKVGMPRLGSLVRRHLLLDRTPRRGDPTHHKGDGIGIGIAAALWIVIVIGTAQPATALQPTLMITTHGNIGNGFKRRHGQTRRGKRLDGEIP